jgi:hypothetical protein
MIWQKQSGTLREPESLLRNYEVNQAWIRIRKNIKKYLPIKDKETKRE